jgi:hypothetical protein
MMGSRHEKIGIKQLIRLEWMDKVLSMLLAGMSEALIRQEIDEYLSIHKPSGGQGERGKKTYGMAISLLSSWFSPDKDLVPFRNDALKLARELPKDKWLPLHWAVISASYPFWFNVAKQVGRLLSLQDKITQKQVFNRLKEQYGDRETIARNARYTVRSFIAWGVLKDSSVKGCYEKGNKMLVSDYKEIIILLESGLLTNEEGKSPLNVLLAFPGFFPFTMPTVTGAFISQNSSRINVTRYGLDDEFLKLSNEVK